MVQGIEHHPVLAQRYLEALGQISNNANKLVFLPFEASGIMSSLGGIKELLQAAPQK